MLARRSLNTPFESVPVVASLVGLWGVPMGEKSDKWLSGSSGKDLLRDLLSGMLSGFVCKIVEYPADTIKVRPHSALPVMHSFHAASLEVVFYTLLYFLLKPRLIT